jgi:uncharacterized protein YggU (UPF0235/DUF167 family)
MTLPDVILSVRVTPRGGRDAIMGVRDGVLHVRVAAPPAGGAANKACAALIARALDLRGAQVALAGGDTSRNKRFSVSGVTPEQVERRLAALPALPA